MRTSRHEQSEAPVSGGTDGRLWQLGEVVAVDGETARIRLAPASSCQRCLSGKGCGAGVFSRLFARRTVELAVDNTIGATPGQRLLVGVTTVALTRVAARLYGAPVLAFVAGVLLVTGFMPLQSTGQGLDDAIVLLAGVAAAAASFAWLARRPFDGIEPVLRAVACRPG